MMWKKKLHHLKRISAISSRRFTSTHFCSSISISTLHDSSIFFSRALFSSLSSLSFSRLDQTRLSSARGLVFPNLSSIHVRQNPVLHLKDENFFSSLAKSAEKLHCWNCGAETVDATSFLFCQACRSVQPVDESIDYFQIFGIGRKCSIEVEELEKKYKDWQKKLHPDLVHSKTQLKLEGMPIDEEERINDPELLAEIMELRETVEDAEDAEALSQIQAQLQEKLRYWSNSFEYAFMRKNFEDAQASIRRMTYYKRANEEIVKKL